MIYIAHRGNIRGRIPERENHPDYLLEAMGEGYDVECDVWFVRNGNSLYLGHDYPQYKIEIDFFACPKVWAHCKDVDSLKILTRELNANCFFHDKDAFTLTSKGYIWCYPRQFTNGGILVHPEVLPEDLNIWTARGLCSDNIERYKLEGEKTFTAVN